MEYSSDDDNKYLNKMDNYVWSNKINGGNNNVTTDEDYSNSAHGGFPPIVPINKKNNTDDSNVNAKREREYATNKKSISITKIMENVKKVNRMNKLASNR